MVCIVLENYSGVLWVTAAANS